MAYDCHFPEELTFSPDLTGHAWISVSDRTLTLYTTDTNLAMETVTLTVTSKITTTHAITPVVTDSSYVLTLKLQRDDCNALTDTDVPAVAELPQNIPHSINVVPNSYVTFALTSPGDSINKCGKQNLAIKKDNGPAYDPISWATIDAGAPSWSAIGDTTKIII